jgi:hypothetical protein
MPTPYVKKLADKHSMSVNAAEKKWQKAKDAVSKDKYPGDSYYAVTTHVFKKMMHESPKILSFKDFINERWERDSETIKSKMNANFVSLEAMHRRREKEILTVAARHIKHGNYEMAKQAAYASAFTHATEDGLSSGVAHKIATIKAKKAADMVYDAYNKKFGEVVSGIFVDPIVGAVHNTISTVQDRYSRVQNAGSAIKNIFQR